MKLIAMICAMLLLGACAADPVRCDAHLSPINRPQRTSTSVTSVHRGSRR